MAKSKIDTMSQKRTEMIREYEELSKATWDEGQTICPTCHRQLPESDIEAMKAEYNLKKSQKLQKINERGQNEASKVMIEEQNNKLLELQTKKTDNEGQIADFERQIGEVKSKLHTPSPFEETENYSEISAKISALQSDELSKGQKLQGSIDAITGNIQSLSDEMSILEDQKARLSIAERQNKRIDELKELEKDLARKYEEIERGVFLCELFIKTKVSLLTDRINSHFKTVRFRLFQEQLNGGVKEDCEVMIPDENGRMVPYTIANNAARINAGLEIIDVLSRKYGISMPVFVDNAESVTKLIQMDSQVIRLVVSESDKTLRLEVA